MEAQSLVKAELTLEMSSTTLKYKDRTLHKGRDTELLPNHVCRH